MVAGLQYLHSHVRSLSDPGSCARHLSMLARVHIRMLTQRAACVLASQAAAWAKHTMGVLRDKCAADKLAILYSHVCDVDALVSKLIEVLTQLASTLASSMVEMVPRVVQTAKAGNL